jgi:hypothetical protein
VLGLLSVHQPKVGFMDERRRLQSLPRLFMRQIVPRRGFAAHCRREAATYPPRLDRRLGSRSRIRVTSLIQGMLTLGVTRVAFPGNRCSQE